MTHRDIQLHSRELKTQIDRKLTLVRPAAFQGKHPIADMPNRLKGLKACVVFDDKDHSKMNDVVRDAFGPDDQVRTGAWWSFIEMLPHIDEDVLLIMSPRKMEGSLLDLREALARFRERNPDALVVVLNLHPPTTEVSSKLYSLRAGDLVDEIVQGFEFFPGLLERSADKQKKRYEMVC